jgi:hypothetical protein
MPRPVDGPRPQSKFGLFLRRWLQRLLVLVIVVFALVGIAATVAQVMSGITNGRWTVDEFHKMFVLEEGTKDLLRILWEQGNRALQYISFFLFAAALFLAAIRLKTVGRVIADFLLARGPIFSLASTVMEVTKTTEKIAGIEPTILLLSEKSDALQKQLAELQTLLSSERTDDGDGGPAPTSGGGRPRDEDSGNWEKLRELWYANTRRIEGIIDRISDGRRKLKYDRMPRTNYPRIIHALARDSLISESAKEASLELHNTFTRYRPRNQRVSDQAIGALEVLDQQLEQEIGRPPPDEDELGTSSMAEAAKPPA